MGLKHLMLAGVLVLGSAVSLSGQTELKTLEDIAAFGADNNLDYRASRNSVLKADDNLQGVLLLDSTTVSATGNYDQRSGQFSVSSKIDVPVTRQVSLSGTLNQDMSGNASLTLSPLAHSASPAQSKISYDSAMISAEASRISAENNAVSAALDWMTAKREFETQKLETDRNKTNYDDDKVRFDKGEITFDDLQNSLVQWSQSRVTLNTKDKSYRDAESALYSALGAGKGDVSVSELSVDDLKVAVESIVSRLNPDRGDAKKNSQYRSAVLDRMSSAAALKNTWAYEPDLKAGATVSFDGAGISNMSASVTLAFSLDNIQKKAREISKEEYAIAAGREEQSRNEAELALSQILDGIDGSAINRDIATIELEQANILLSEAELLYKRGDISELDLEESRLSLQTSENALFKAMADQYKAWSSLREFL